MQMVTNTLENGIDRKILKKGGAYKSGRMGLGMKDNGKIIKPTDMGDSSTQKVMSMKVTGKMTWQMVTDSIQVSLVTTILGSGSTIRGINMEKRSGLMGPSTLGNMIMVPSTALEKYLGMTRTHMKATL